MKTTFCIRQINEIQIKEARSYCQHFTYVANNKNRVERAGADDDDDDDTSYVLHTNGQNEKKKQKNLKIVTKS